MVTLLLFLAGLVFYRRGEKERAKKYFVAALILQLIAILIRIMEANL